MEPEKRIEDGLKRTVTEDLIMINLEQVPGSSSFQEDPIIEKHHYNQSAYPSIIIQTELTLSAPIEIKATAGSHSADSPTQLQTQSTGTTIGSSSGGNDHPMLTE